MLCGGEDGRGGIVVVWWGWLGAVWWCESLCAVCWCGQLCIVCSGVGGLLWG